MTESPMKTAAKHVFLHSPRRTWITPSGRVVRTPTRATQPPVVKTVEWEAHVVDVATGTKVEAYPSLSGEITVTNQASSDHEIALAYLNKCRFIDGEKPDVELLQRNVNAGLWEVAVNTEEHSHA